MKKLKPEKAYLWQWGYTQAQLKTDAYTDMSLTGIQRDSKEFQDGLAAGKKRMLINLVKGIEHD